MAGTYLAVGVFELRLFAGNMPSNLNNHIIYSIRHECKINLNTGKNTVFYRATDKMNPMNTFNVVSN